MPRWQRIVVVLAVFVAVRELVTLTHDALWTPELGWWSGLVYYALWVSLLVPASMLLGRPRAWPSRDAWTRRNVLILVLVVIATEALYGFRATRVAIGDVALHEPAAWQYLVNAMIAAPLVEEWLFRGLLWDAIDDRDRDGVPWLALVITSLLFGPWHWGSFFAPSAFGAGGTWLPYHIEFGLFMGVVRWRFGSIGLCVVIHGAWNALTPLTA